MSIIAKRSLRITLALALLGLIAFGFVSWKYYSSILKEERLVKIIIAKNNGGQLANQLWQFATLAAYCKEKEYELYNPAFFHYAKYFEHFHDDIVISPTRPFKVFLPHIQEVQRRSHRILVHLLKNHFPNNRCSPTFEAPLQLSCNDSQLILKEGNHFFFDWYFVNWEGIEKHKAYIREMLKPKKMYTKRIDRFWKDIEADRLIVGVHIRHKDFKTWNEGRYFFSVDQVKEHMQAIQNHYAQHRPFFIIYSDEPRSQKEFQEFDVKISQGNLVEDLYSMARCDLIVGVGKSTFNGWAAWYGNVPRYKLEDPPTWDFLDQNLKNPLFCFQDEEMPPRFCMK